MTDFRAIGLFIKQYPYPKISQQAIDIMAKKKIDLDKDGTDEIADLDGNGETSEEELGKFYINNRNKFPKTDENNLLLLQIDAMVTEVKPQCKIDQAKIDKLIDIALNPNVKKEDRIKAVEIIINAF